MGQGHRQGWSHARPGMGVAVRGVGRTSQVLREDATILAWRVEMVIAGAPWWMGNMFLCILTMMAVREQSLQI